MPLHNPLLRRQIRLATQPQKTSLLCALGLLASLPVAPIQAAETHQQWSCSPSADGASWICNERTVPGPSYERPKHSFKRISRKAASADAGTPSKARNLPAAQTDWVDEKLLSEEQKQAMRPGCCGAYVEPTRDDEDANLKPSEASLKASANSSELQKDSVAKLDGDVRLTQGYRLLESDSALLNQEANTAKLTGNIRLREPGLLLTGAQADIDMNSDDAVITDASYLLHEAGLRGDATTLKHLGDNRMVMEDATFTQCEPDSNMWEFESSELELDPNSGQGKGKHVRLKIKGVPVFYTPYIQFPISGQRMSGFLFPSIGSSDDNGVDIATPYYLNLAPNYDMTITPRFISDRGEMLEVEARHLSQHTESDISIAYLADDKGGQDDQLDEQVDLGNLTEDEAYRYKGEDRWLADINHKGNFGNGIYTLIDYTRVSDIDYFRDLDTVSLAVSSTTHLKESGTIGYRTANWNSSVKVEQFQTIARNTTTPYQQMPRINVDGSYDLGWNLKAELNNEYTDFDHRDADDEVWVTGQRAFLDYGITWDKEWVWGFFKPSVMVKHLSYELDDKHLDADANDSPSVTVPQGSLDMGLYFEREGSLLGRGYIQTFEPRLFYFYSDYESHDELFDVAGTRDIDFDTSELTFTYSQLFRDRRFSGHDRIGDDNRLSVGLTTRFIEAATGIERFSASVGQIYYYDDRAVDLSVNSATAKTLTENLEDTSEIAVAMSARIGDYWQFNSDLLFDEDDNNKTSRGSMSLRYRDDNYNLFNIGYRYVRKDAVADVNDVDNDGDVAELIDRDIEQADVSFALPIGGNWSAVARYNHDVTNSRELETLAGLEYSDCCYRVRVVARRWLDNDLHTVIDDTLLEEDQGIFFEFQLRGLGGIGSKVNGVLSDGIYGYDLREENLK